MITLKKLTYMITIKSITNRRYIFNYDLALLRYIAFGTKNTQFSIA